MVPVPKVDRARRAAASDAAHVSGTYMAFSMSLHVAYEQATFASASKSSRPHIQPRHSTATAAAAAAAAVPRARSSRKTVAHSGHRAHQLLESSNVIPHDTTHKRLSTEAQLIQDGARQSYKVRISNHSDRESLRCLESFPLHITTRPALTDHPTMRKTYTPPVLPKYFPSAPRKFRSSRFDHDATQTTQPTYSSGQPLKSVPVDGKSFLDDTDLSQDDDFFRNHGQEVGDLLPMGGISLFAHLEYIRAREAGQSRGPSSASSSSPIVPPDGTLAMSGYTMKEAGASTQNQSEDEELEDWQHVETSAIVNQKISKQNQQRRTDGTDVATRKNLANEVAVESEMVKDDTGANNMSESGNVDWHLDHVELANAMYESKPEGDPKIDDFCSNDGDAVNEKVADAVAVDMDQAVEEQENDDDEICANGNILKSNSDKEVLAGDLEEEDGWLQVEIPEGELKGDEF